MEAAASKTRTTQALAVTGGAAIAVGSLLPWATASHMFGQTSFAGTDGDGVFTLIIGAAVALIAWLRLDHSTWRAVAFIGCLLAGVIVLGVMVGVADVGNDSVLTSAGAGLYVVLIGAVLAAAAIVVHARAE